MWASRCELVLPNGKMFINPKKNVKNKVKPKACMAFGYMYDETLGFYTKYFALYLHMCYRMWDTNEKEANIGEVLEMHV
jgi:hypothetical protein